MILRTHTHTHTVNNYESRYYASKKLLGNNNIHSLTHTFSRVSVYSLVVLSLHMHGGAHHLLFTNVL